MIDRVHFENFKSLADVTLDLSPLTALVGPNGCGKTSVLDGVRMLSRLAGMGALPTVAGESTLARLQLVFEDLRRYARRVPGRLTLALRNDAGHELQLDADVPARAKEPMAFEVHAGLPERSLEASISAASPGGDIFGDPRLTQFDGISYLRLDARVMAQTSVPVDVEPRLEIDGAGLASTLAWMKGTDQLGHIVEDLALIVPGAKGIVTSREKVTLHRVERLTIDGQVVRRPVEEEVLGDRFAVQFDTGGPIFSDLLSEGTVLALGLLTKLREPQRPKVFLLDDIDRGLHPGAQSRLIDVLRSMMRLDPDLQVIFTTHSPYLLDRLEAEEVRVLSLDTERRTRVQPLTSHPDYEKWRYGIQSGEMWTALGDSWVADGTVGKPAA